MCKWMVIRSDTLGPLLKLMGICQNSQFNLDHALIRLGVNSLEVVNFELFEKLWLGNRNQDKEGESCLIATVSPISHPFLLKEI